MQQPHKMQQPQMMMGPDIHTMMAQRELAERQIAFNEQLAERQLSAQEARQPTKKDQQALNAAQIAQLVCQHNSALDFKETTQWLFNFFIHANDADEVDKASVSMVSSSLVSNVVSDQHHSTEIQYNPIQTQQKG